MQALTKDYYSKSKRRKRKKRQQDHVPLRVRSRECFTVGDYGSRGATHAKARSGYYNCQVKINGLKIRGRLPGQAPAGRVLEGVSVTKLADGWWASIKVEVPARTLPSPAPGTVVGIDVGLMYIAAFSDGSTPIKNARDGAYSARIAAMQTLGKDTSRLQQQQSRNVRHLIYSRILPRVADKETIKIEQLPAWIGQRGSRMTSVMRTVAKMLVDRYGDRVREVDPAFTSQDCSQCGVRSKEAWSYEAGPVCTCPSCGYREHRDVNAARNIAAKEALPLVKKAVL